MSLPGSKQLTNASLQGAGTAGSLASWRPCLIDKNEAKECLSLIAEKVVTGAAKKRARAAAAAEREHAKRRNQGEARRAWREKIATRPPTSTRVVYDKTGNFVS